MIFAISISIYSSAMNIERKVSSTIKEISAGISVICCFICLVFYGFLYHPSSNNNLKAVHIIQIVFAGIALLVICLGFVFELKSDDINSKNQIVKEELKLYEV